jgi:hypothetical protein
MKIRIFLGALLVAALAVVMSCDADAANLDYGIGYANDSEWDSAIGFQFAARELENTDVGLLLAGWSYDNDNWAVDAGMDVLLVECQRMKLSLVGSVGVASLDDSAVEYFRGGFAVKVGAEPDAKPDLDDALTFTVGFGSRPFSTIFVMASFGSF